MNNRVLIFTDWYYPGYKSGGPVTSLFALTGHLQEEVDFYVLTRNTDYCESKPYENIPASQWVRVNGNTQVYYFGAKDLNRENMLKAISGINFHTWYINGIYSWYFSILPLLLSRKVHPGKVVISPRGMLSEHALQVKPFRKRFFLFIAKQINLYRSCIFHATFPGEENDIQRFFPANPVLTIPNLPRIMNTPVSLINKKPGELNLFSLARIAPEKNTLGALQFLNDLGKHFKGRKDYWIHFHLFGRSYNPSYLRECKELAGKMPPQIRVHFRGSIPPQEIPARISEHHFLLMPSYGENYGHAIIESLSAGRPVIISDRTPWQDLDKHHCGWSISLKQPDVFINVLKRCLDMDKDEFTRMHYSALDYARGNLNTKEVKNKYLNLLKI